MIKLKLECKLNEKKTPEFYRTTDIKLQCKL